MQVEVMLKEILQPLLAYVMEVYHLPIIICHKRLHPFSWIFCGTQRMARGKCCGSPMILHVCPKRMWVWRLFEVNQALLPRQAWSLIIELVHFHAYFSHMDFMMANHRRSCVVWKGLVIYVRIGDICEDFWTFFSNHMWG